MVPKILWGETTENTALIVPVGIAGKSPLTSGEVVWETCCRHTWSACHLYHGLRSQYLNRTGRTTLTDCTIASCWDFSPMHEALQSKPPNQVPCWIASAPCSALMGGGGVDANRACSLACCRWGGQKTSGPLPCPRDGLQRCAAAQSTDNAEIKPGHSA